MPPCQCHGVRFETLTQIGYRVRFNDPSQFDWSCFRSFSQFYFEEDVLHGEPPSQATAAYSVVL
jgi:hypothetical protein